MALDFIAGCLGGFAGTIVSYPFDTVKVRLQNQNSADKVYSSTWNCFKQIVKKESLLGFYKGVWSPLYGTCFINAIVFGIHGNTLNQFRKSGLYTQIIAGSAAGYAQSFVCTPIELVKIRLQMQIENDSRSILITDKYKYTGTVDCVKKIYIHERGFQGLYRGYVATLCREVPSYGVYFGSYYYLCKKTKAIHEGEIKFFRLLFCGGIAGMLCWISSYPFDVIKTRLQMDGMNGKYLYKGIIDCSIKSYKQEGLTVFFRGLNATLIRAFPCNAATLSTASLVVNFFKSSDYR